MAGPIKPCDVIHAKRATIPEEVFTVFNELIISKWDGRSACVLQDEAVAAIVRKLETKGVTRDEIFSKRWLDIEDSYRELGWHVEYDKPGYNESYDAHFIFRHPHKL